MPSRTRTLRALLACLISGLIAGLLTASQCWRAGADCRIAAVQALSSDPVSWTIWLHWVNWLPGLVFGFLFSLATVDWTLFPWQRVLLFASAATLSYVVAELVFAAFIEIAGADEFALVVWIWPAGFVAGGVGAALLRLASHQLLVRADRSGWSLRRDWASAFVGALAGILFVFIALVGEQRILLAWPVAFILWQVAVGLALQPPTAAVYRAQG
jgi:hypothetical protein